MFTGIIQAVGSVGRLTRRGEDAYLSIETSLDLHEITIGASLAVNGACLTVTGKGDRGFEAFVSAETLQRTNLSRLKTGNKVNLEKALRLSDFLSGHLVLGHVDGMGKVIEKTAQAQSVRFGIEAAQAILHYVVEKGSVALDGISLTVNRCEKNRFYVNIIPHTAQETTLGRAQLGAMVNIETDILGKYVERLIQRSGGIDRDFLKKHGML